jgi:hypothetical protein
MNERMIEYIIIDVNIIYGTECNTVLYSIYII